MLVVMVALRCRRGSRSRSRRYGARGRDGSCGGGGRVAVPVVTVWLAADGLGGRGDDRLGRGAGG